jgi:3-hydroxyisobutyrate dehydrogenase-like beta-hydroxyacid dehydrogenase
MDIRFIGLGNMGSVMARCLIQGGHRLTVYNRTRAKADQLAADGAVVFERPADVCHGDAVITMLAVGGSDIHADGIGTSSESAAARARWMSFRPKLILKPAG